MTDTGQHLWHNIDKEKAIALLGSKLDGLSSEEAKQRLERYGLNELVEKKKTSPLMLLLEQFKDFLIIILIIAAIISAVLAFMGEGDIWDPILIIIIVLFAAVLGFIQEYRSEKAIEALKRMAALTAIVIRNSRDIEIPAREVVPGDLVVLNTGNRVPADGRIIESINLKTDEAPLTGESLPVEKITDVLPAEMPLGDRRNMVFSGTTVVYGRGLTLVTSTGMNTEFGKITGMLQEVETGETPLQESLDKAGKLLGIASLIIVAVVGSIGVLGHLFESYLGAFIWAVSLAVAAVPEALPAVVTITLALGVQRMAKRHALVRRMTAVETLGCTTYICSDKTGTLTQGQMTVRKIFAGNRTIEVTGAGYEPKGEFQLDGQPYRPESDKHLQMLLRISTLCNDAHLIQEDNRWLIRGDPTEGALIVAAAKADIKAHHITAEQPRLKEIPFSSERKRMTTVHRIPEGLIALSKGAPEVVLSTCSHIYLNNNQVQLSQDYRDKILSLNQQLAGDGLRVLGMAYKVLPDISTPDDSIEADMIFSGLVGMIDPPRPEVKAAIQVCEKANITSVMITGDHKLTAIAVANELGLLKEGQIAVTGSDLDSMSPAQFEEQVENIAVYARVSPAHKMQIVEALQKKGHIVSMTGDGVNDAPALKKADIGVAMGITGTDVTREAAAMVLTDDNFASIVAAIEEGRNIFANIKKFLAYLLSCNIGEVLLMLMAFTITTLGGEHVLPLIALQLLFVNLVTDGLPAIALAMDPPDPDIMTQAPRPKKEGVFSKSVIRFIGGVGFWTAVVTLGTFQWAIYSGRDAVEAQSVCFATIVIVQLFNCFNCRSERHSIFKIGLFSNRWLLAAIASSLILTIPLFYIPALQGPFHTYPMGWRDWAIIVPSAASVLVVVELAKLLARQRSKIAK